MPIRAEAWSREHAEAIAGRYDRGSVVNGNGERLTVGGFGGEQPDASLSVDTIDGVAYTGQQVYAEQVVAGSSGIRVAGWWIEMSTGEVIDSGTVEPESDWSVELPALTAGQEATLHVRDSVTAYEIPFPRALPTAYCQYVFSFSEPDPNPGAALLYDSVAKACGGGAATFWTHQGAGVFQKVAVSEDMCYGDTDCAEWDGNPETIGVTDPYYPPSSYTMVRAANAIQADLTKPTRDARWYIEVSTGIACDPETGCDQFATTDPGDPENPGTLPEPSSGCYDMFEAVWNDVDEWWDVTYLGSEDGIPSVTEWTQQNEGWGEIPFDSSSASEIGLSTDYWTQNFYQVNIGSDDYRVHLTYHRYQNRWSLRAYKNWSSSDAWYLGDQAGPTDPSLAWAPVLGVVNGEGKRPVSWAAVDLVNPNYPGDVLTVSMQ